MSVFARGHRFSLLWVAALAHRLSGIGLALFLPFHFLLLSLALGGAGTLDAGLRFTDQPLVKLAEGGLVFLLCVHLLGGLRLLAVENLAWRGGQQKLALLVFAAAFMAALFFLMRLA